MRGNQSATSDEVAPAGQSARQESFLAGMEELLRIHARFLSADAESELILLTDPKRRYGNLHDEIDLDRTVVVDSFSNEEYDSGFRSLFVYEEHLLRQIQTLQPRFGQWNGYCFVADFNGNGIDEIIGFQMSGSSYLPRILEYDGAEFVSLLEFRTYAMSFSHIEFRNNRRIYIVGYGDTRFDDRDYDWYLYQWSEEHGRYRVVESGLIDPSEVPKYRE